MDLLYLCYPSILFSFFFFFNTEEKNEVDMLLIELNLVLK